MRGLTRIATDASCASRASSCSLQSMFKGHVSMRLYAVEYPGRRCEIVRPWLFALWFHDKGDRVKATPGEFERCLFDILSCQLLTRVGAQVSEFVGSPVMSDSDFSFKVRSYDQRISLGNGGICRPYGLEGHVYILKCRARKRETVALMLVHLLACQSREAH